MSNFWPAGIELNDTQSPEEILESAKADWDAESNGLLTLVFQEAKSQSKNDMIIVHAKHIPSERTAALFTVVHRPEAHYPATIQPKSDELPNFLKKSYYQPGFSDLKPLSVVPREGNTVNNAWVSDTPSEFRKKLIEVFNLGAIKSEIVSLLASNSRIPESNGEEQSEESEGDN